MMVNKSLSSLCPANAILLMVSGDVPGFETTTVMEDTDFSFTVPKLMLVGEKLIKGCVTSRITDAVAEE